MSRVRKDLVKKTCSNCGNTVLKKRSSPYKKHSLYFYGHKCYNNNCELIKNGIDIPTKMLDVDHIDCNRGNNSIENLQVLCVWCHALKTRNI